MTDVIIKDVPEGAEESVKYMAMIAIERFINTRDSKPSEVLSKSEIEIDAIRSANKLTLKFAKPIIEEKTNGVDLNE
jgi:hypothetical protein